jgi:putative ABC transport system permease protein
VTGRTVPRPAHGGLPSALLRAAPGASLLVAATALVTAFALTAVPAWFSRSADAALPAMLAAAPAGQRGLEFEQSGVIEEVAGDPLGNVAAAGDAIKAALPSSLSAIAGSRIDVVDSQEHLAFNAPVNVTRVALRIQPSAAAGIALAAGVLPTAHRSTRPVEGLKDATGQLQQATVIEVALSTATADVIGMHLGDELVLLPGQGRQGAMVVRVVGLFTVIDPADPRWFSDASLDHPVANRVSLELTIYHAVALLSPDAYPLLLDSGGSLVRFATGGARVPARYRWRFPVDPHAVSNVDPARLLADLTRTQAANPFHGSEVPGLSTSLPGILEQFRLQRQTADTAFALSILGPMAAGLGILAVVASALARRRRSSLQLLRARGAGRGRLAVASSVSAAAIVAGPSLLGALAAAAGLGARWDTAAISAGWVVLGAGLLVVASDAPTFVAAGAGRGTRGVTLLPPARRRVVDAFVITVAVLGAIGLQTRSSGAAPGSGLDLATAGIPVLLALAGGIVVVRVFKVAVGGLSRLAARGRGLGAVHALRGLWRGSRGYDPALVVLVVAVAAGVFSSSVTATVADSQGRAAANAVGADYRITSTTPGGLPARLDLGQLRALGAVALGVETAGSLASPMIAGETVGVAALDVAAYEQVVRGTAVDPGLAAALSSSEAGAGTPPAPPTDAAPLLLVVRGDLAGRTGLGVGTRLTLRLGGTPLPAVVHAISAALPGVPAADGVVVGLDALHAAVPDTTFAPTIALLRAPPSAADAVARVVAPYLSQVQLADRAALERTLRQALLVGTMRDGFLVALLLTSLFAAAVVAATAAQVIALRTRETVLLGALGMASRGALGITIAELWLTVLVAIGAGVALGLGVALLTLPDLGLERLAGAGVVVRPAIDASGVLLAVAGPAVSGLAVVLGFALATRPAGLAPRMLSDEA